jgi:hypothetical protein
MGVRGYICTRLCQVRLSVSCLTRSAEKKSCPDPYVQALNLVKVSTRLVYAMVMKGVHILYVENTLQDRLSTAGARPADPRPGHYRKQ